jgi:hypothetical protein
VDLGGRLQRPDPRRRVDRQALQEGSQALAQGLARRGQDAGRQGGGRRLGRQAEGVVPPGVQGQGGQRLPQRRLSQVRRAGAPLAGGDKTTFQGRQSLLLVTALAEGVQRQDGPGEVLDVVGGGGVLPQVRQGAGDALVAAAALQGQERQGGRRGDRLQGDAEDAAVAVVDAAGGQHPVQQQLVPLGDPRVAPLANAAQGQAGPRGRLDPREVALRPRPADQRPVDVVDVVLGGRAQGPAAQGEQGPGDGVEALAGGAELGQGKQHKRGGPGGLAAAAAEAVGAVAGGALLQPGGRPGDGVRVPVLLGRQGEQGEAGRLGVRRLIGSVAPAALGAGEFGEGVHGGAIAHQTAFRAIRRLYLTHSTRNTWFALPCLVPA